jgi:hypothetical protein
MKGKKICGGSVLIVARSYAIMPHAAMGLPGSGQKTGLGHTVANFRLEGIRSSQLDYFRLRLRHCGIESTSSQLWPAAISTFNGTDSCRADVITRFTRSANRVSSAAGASKTSSSWI